MKVPAGLGTGPSNRGNPPFGADVDYAMLVKKV
jgi:hypothetical protein